MNEIFEDAIEQAMKGVEARMWERLDSEVLHKPIKEVHIDPPPSVEMPKDLPTYIRYLITAKPGEMPRGNMGNGMYEATPEVARALFYNTFGWY